MTDLTAKEELKRLLPGPAVQLGWVALIVVLLVAYYVGVRGMIINWTIQAEYGHCFFVPVFAVLLLWMRRDMAYPLPQKGSWWGLAFLGLMVAMKVVAFFFRVPLMDTASLIPCIAGITLIVGGWQAMRWSWPSICFLVFMLPLPGVLVGFMSLPLQKLGAVVSVFVIQTLGIPAIREGNVINLPGGPLEVARACSGMRMLMLFFAICVGAALILREKPLWERLLIVVSAAPIALISNMMRITATAFLYECARWWPDLWNVKAIDDAAHDYAGFFMMPLGLLLLWAELAIISKLIIEPAEESLSPLVGTTQIGIVGGNVMSPQIVDKTENN